MDVRCAKLRITSSGVATRYSSLVILVSVKKIRLDTMCRMWYNVRMKVRVDMKILIVTDDNQILGTIENIEDYNLDKPMAKRLELLFSLK